MTPTKYKVHQWLDMDTMQPLYGVDAKMLEDGKWYHVSEGNKPLFFTDEKDAKKRVKLLNDDLKS